MASQGFFQRWKQLSRRAGCPLGWGRREAGPVVVDSAESVTLAFVSPSPQQEVQNIFKAKHPMDTEITKAKVMMALFGAFPSGGPISLLSHQSAPTLPFPLCRSLGLVLHSLKKLTLILPTLWEPVSSTPEPPRLVAYFVWSRIYRPRSGLLLQWLNTLKFLLWRDTHRNADPSAGAWCTCVTPTSSRAHLTFPSPQEVAWCPRCLLRPPLKATMCQPCVS